MRSALLAALAASLGGCSIAPAEWRADTVAVIEAPAMAPRAGPRPCPQIDTAIADEAQRLTPIGVSSDGNTDGLTAALMNSEAAKNARLRQVLLAYERCRQLRP